MGDNLFLIDMVRRCAITLSFLTSKGAKDFLLLILLLVSYPLMLIKYENQAKLSLGQPTI